MILADENIDKSIIEAIRNEGFEVISIFEIHRGISDFQIIELSRNPPRLILTEDKDFGEWIFAHKVKDISVLLLRYSFSETLEITKVVLNLLKFEAKTLTGSTRISHKVIP